KERTNFFLAETSASVQFTCSATSSTDCRPALAAISTRSSNVPLRVQSITEDVIFALFGNPLWAFSRAPAVTVSSSVLRVNIRLPCYRGGYLWNRYAAREVLYSQQHRGDSHFFRSLLSARTNGRVALAR